MNNNQNYKDVLRNLGLRMQLFRKQKNLTQEEMAFRINKSKDTVSNMERGLAFARIETLIDISNVLEIKLTDLFDYPISKNSTTKKARLINDISKHLSTQNENQIKKYFEMIKLMD